MVGGIGDVVVDDVGGMFVERIWKFVGKWSKWFEWVGKGDWFGVLGLVVGVEV